MNFYRTWDVILDNFNKITSKEVDKFVEDRFTDEWLFGGRKETDYKFHGLSEGIHLIIHIEVINQNRINNIYCDDNNLNVVNALLDTVGYSIINES